MPAMPIPRGMIRRAARIWMPCAIGALLAANPSARAQAPTETPRDIMRQATLATQGDSVGAVAAHWRARVEQRSDDRLAALGLATLAAWTFDTVGAERGFRALLAGQSGSIRPAASGDGVTRYAQLGYGLLLYNKGRFFEAGKVFADVAQTARVANDTLAEAEALVRLVPLEIRWPNAAIGAHMARADSIIPASAPDLRAAAACARAMMLAVTRGTRVLETARAGSRLARQAGDVRQAALCDLIVATTFSRRAQLDSSLAAFDQVIDEASRGRDYGLRATALQWRGFVRLSAWQLGMARVDFDRAITEGLATGNLAAVGWSALNLASIDDLVLNWFAARRQAAFAHSVFVALGDSAGLGILRRIEGGAALEVGDTAAARVSLTDALRVAERSGEVVDILNAHTWLAGLEIQEHRWDEAAADMAAEYRVAAEHGASRLTVGLSRFDGRIALARGDARRAIRLFNEAQATTDTAAHFDRYGLDEELAVARLHAGDTVRAINELERANTEVDAWRRTLDDAELRTLVFQSVNVIGGPRSAAPEVITAAVRSGRIPDAFSLAERRRARELVDQLTRARALGVDQPGGSHATELDPARPSPAVSLADLQQAIPDDSTAVLEYVTGRDGVRTTLLRITRRDARGWLLPPVDSLASTVDRLDLAIDQALATAEPARALGNTLLAPALTTLPSTVTRLIILPDGMLHRVPFAALRTSDGRAVVERFAVSVAPSATVLVELWKRSVAPRSPVVLAFGDPALSGATRRAMVDTAISVDRDAAADAVAAGELPSLPLSGDEARLVAAFADEAVVRTGREASAGYLESRPLGSFTIVHFATHAVVDDNFPARSAIALAPDGGRSGFVTMSDLAALRLNADLVVLSACRTARGGIVAGEGVRGLTSPLLAAGARSVLATQWRVSDRAAVSLVYGIYRGLAAGVPVGEAVRRAEVAALRSGAPDREWAAFTVVGDPFVRIPLHAPSPDRIPSWLRS